MLFRIDVFGLLWLILSHQKRSILLYDHSMTLYAACIAV